MNFLEEVVGFACIVSYLSLATAVPTKSPLYPRQEADPWFQDGIKKIEENLEVKIIDKKAKGVILFVGDGMGPSTVTAARILDGQLRGGTGEENVLSWETFPNVAFSKTYNTNQQVSDSAGTATAFMTGVKARSGVISVNENTIRGNCSTQMGNEVLSIAMIAEQQGLSTGVVTTTRITHATPSTAYAHAASRSWESDANLPEDAKGSCEDIAKQLIYSKYGDGLDVIMGGGRKNFISENDSDYKNKTWKGVRKDGKNLINEWLFQNLKSGKTRKFVHNRTAFKHLIPKAEEQVLGLFNYDHMEYEIDRNKTNKEPSLPEMVEFAIKSLSTNPKGFFLLVEGGRIDHAHHKNQPVYALHEAVQLANAVKKAKELTNPEETLLMVTADHSHVFTIGGYQKRGNDIFGHTRRNGLDRKRFSTLSYANGPGGKTEWPNGRHEPTLEELHDPHYMYETLVPLVDENHGGEDVGIYASGPQAHLVRGVVEQNYIFHVMDYALCLTESKKEICPNNIKQEY